MKNQGKEKLSKSCMFVQKVFHVFIILLFFLSCNQKKEFPKTCENFLVSSLNFLKEKNIEGFKNTFLPDQKESFNSFLGVQNDFFTTVIDYKISLEKQIFRDGGWFILAEMKYPNKGYGAMFFYIEKYKDGCALNFRKTLDEEKKLRGDNMFVIFQKTETPFDPKLPPEVDTSKLIKEKK